MILRKEGAAQHKGQPTLVDSRMSAPENLRGQRWRGIHQATAGERGGGLSGTEAGIRWRMNVTRIKQTKSSSEKKSGVGTVQ